VATVEGKTVKMEKDKIQLLNSSEFDGNLKDGSLLVLVVSKPEVLKCEVGDLVDRLMKISDNPENIKKAAGKLVLVFEGWDKDRRELCEIPEVVTYFKVVNHYWPYWFHFCETLGNTIGLVCYLLCPMERRKVNGKSVVATKTPEDLKNVIGKLFDSMNSFYAANGLSIEENKQTSDRVLGALKRAFA
jgi:hypothetical protein